MFGFELRAHDLAELIDDGVGDGAHCGKPFTSCGDHTCVFQNRQVLGNVGLTGASSLYELTHVLFTMHKRTQQPKTHWLGKGAELLRNEIQGNGRQKAGGC